MNTKVISTLLLATVSLSLTGCFAGRTSVTASQYASRPYDIYLNGQPVCRMGSDEDCSFQTRGTRAGGMLEAYLDGQRVGAVEVHRSISAASILWIPLTYGMSLFLYKAYPDDIEIPIDTYVTRPSYSNNNEQGGSVWDRPYSSSNKVKKTVKQQESVMQPSEYEEPKAVRGEDAEFYDEAAPAKKSVWD